MTTKTDEFITYVKECARLLYWTYFKPYTLRRYLREIDPDLSPYTNPFFPRDRFAASPRLRRYAEQVWWLAIIIPVLTLATLIVHSLLNSTSNWDDIQVIVAWLFGLWLMRIMAKWTTGRVIVMGVLAVVNFLEISPLEFVFPDWVQSISVGVLLVYYPTYTYRATFGMLLACISGIAVFIVFSRMGDVATIPTLIALGLTIGMLLDRSVSIIISIGGSILLSIGFIIVSISENSIGSIASDIAFIIVFGIALGGLLILGSTRILLWLPELVWVCILKFSPKKRNIILCYLPPRFDELIILPLPFMENIIAEAYRENRAAARNTITYLINSTSQQKVAARAITLIAADTLAAGENAVEIAAVADQLDWLPAETTTPALRQFLEIAQGVRAALEGTSLYRQCELLAFPINKLRGMRDSLAFASPAEATRFGGVVERWLTILETARRTMQDRAAASSEIPQAYLPGQPLDPDRAGERFKGRVDLFRRIETLTLSAQRPVLLLYGGRRTGKTSALKYLPRRVVPELVPLVVDMQGIAAATTLRGLAEGLAAEIIKSAQETRKLTLPAPDAAALARDPFIALQRWMDEIEKKVRDRTLFLCLDEYERLSEIVDETGSRAPLNFLRHVMQHRRRWTLLFSGAHYLDELPAYWSDYLINTQALRVSYLDEKDARELITQPVANFPDIYAADAVTDIVRLTRGQPYLVQLLCYELVELLNREKRARVELPDVDAVLPNVFESGAQYFREFWELTLDAAQREIVTALARDEPLADDLRRAAEVLVRKEVLERIDGEYRFQVPLIRRWVEVKIAE